MVRNVWPCKRRAYFFLGGGGNVRKNLSVRVPQKEVGKRSSIREGPPGLIQHVLAVLAFWSSCCASPGFHLRLGASDCSPLLAFCFIGPLDICLDLLPAGTAHVFAAQGATRRPGIHHFFHFGPPFCHPFLHDASVTSLFTLCPNSLCWTPFAAGCLSSPKLRIAIR